jgi:hypothetical protein
MGELCAFYKANCSPRSDHTNILVNQYLTDITYTAVSEFSIVTLSPCLVRASTAMLMRLVGEKINTVMFPG